MNLEVFVLPVADVDRAWYFYERLRFRLDIDSTDSEEFRVVQLTPPGSAASIVIGTGASIARPGSVQGLHLIVTDIKQAHAHLVDHGVEVSEIFHDAGGFFHRPDPDGCVSGAHPERVGHSSFASFSDP